MPQIWIRIPDTPEQIAYKLKMAELSKVALETCLDNMRKSLLKNVNTWKYIKTNEFIKEMKQTQVAIDTTKKLIEKLKSKLS